MAAVTRPYAIGVRAAEPGEGTEIASLWRELWNTHEGWGGYPGLHDVRVYERLASRLDQDARVRAGQPVLGRHIHLVATLHDDVVGQVEGWFDRHGSDPLTPFTCEVRSLIVRTAARKAGVGRALLEYLGRIAANLGRGAPVVLAAEVLEPNPAHSFYARIGYRPVAFSARMDATNEASERTPFAARMAASGDALAVAVLESTLAARRRASGDLRFDRPRSVDATFVGAIAAHLARPRTDDDGGPGSEPFEIVTTDSHGNVRASASFAVSTLEPPFAPIRRALLGRFALDPASAPGPLLAPLIAMACRLAVRSGAPHLELTDLTGPGSALHNEVVRLGARPWSRIVTRMATVRR